MSTNTAYADIGEMLQKDYLPGLIVEINEDIQDTSPTVSVINQDSTHIAANGQITFAPQYGRSGGVGFRTDDGAMPKQNPRKVKQVTMDVRNIFGHIQLTDKAIKTTRAGAAAFAPVLENELASLKIDCMEAVARSFFGDGTGLLGITTGAVASHVITLAAKSDAINFAEGMYIDSFTSGAVAHDSCLEVTAVDWDAGTVTVTGDATTITGDYLYAYGSKDLEFRGLKTYRNTNTSLYSLTRATYPFLKIGEKDQANAEISPLAIWSMIRARENKSGHKIDHLLCSDGVIGAYSNVIIATSVLVNTTELVSGVKGPTGMKFPAFDFGGRVLPLVPEKYCAPGELWGMPQKDWACYQAADWDWVSDNGGSVLQGISGFAAFEAKLAKYADWGCLAPQATFRLYNIPEHLA
jgi:hypothetical protein